MMNELYKKEICINCVNENCTNKIRKTKEIEDNEITVIKCEDFICKSKRKKPANWQKW